MTPMAAHTHRSHGERSPRHAAAPLATGLFAVALALAGCGDAQADAASRIEALPNIGAAAKAGFTEELAGLDSEDDLEAVVTHATAINDLVGQPLGWIDGTTPKGRPRLTLEKDGTVTGDDRALLMMGSPTHWRPGQDTFDLCTTQDCTYWSAWDVQAATGGQYVFSLVGGDNPLTRILAPGQ